MAADSKTPIVWTIAGSDSGGGAGIQADLKVMNAFGVHGCSVLTALTAQNTQGIQQVEAVGSSMVRAQFQTLLADLPPTTIKMGMLGSVDTCRTLADVLQSTDAPVICDPVLKSTSGADLLDPVALDALVRGIFPRVELLTPNRPEAEQLTGQKIKTPEDAAESLLAMGVKSVLIKGGHTEEHDCRDYWTDGTQALWLSSPRVHTDASHGTGCILSSAIASAMALGQSVQEAIITAKTYMNQCLHAPAGIGSGHGPMRIEPFLDRPADQPRVAGHPVRTS